MAKRTRKRKARNMHRIIVNGATMVHGPGYLSQAKKEQWIQTYLNIAGNRDVRAENYRAKV
jgi:hypothetical protein